MKTKSLFTFCFIVLYSSFIVSGFGQGTAFTYQGRLNSGTNAANGAYDLRFALFDALTAGNQVGSPLTNSPVNVSNGLFTVTLDFGASFPGADRWLEIGVRTNGGGAFTNLIPRQPITATPYAITAGNLSVALPSANLSGTYANPVTLNNGANSFSGNGAGLTSLNAANLTGAVPSATLTSVPAGSLTGTVPDARLSANVALLAGSQTFTGAKSFSSEVTANNGLRLNNSNLWLRSDNNHGLGWHGNGKPFATVSNLIDGPVLFGYGGGALGTKQFGIEGIALLWNSAGNVGIGTTNPQFPLDVNGKVKMTQFQLGLSATAGQILTADAAGVGSWQTPAFAAKIGDTFTGDVTIANPGDLNFGSTTRQMINLWFGIYGIGVQANTLYQRSDGGFAWFRQGTHNDGQNNPGTGGTNLMSLDASGNLFANASITVDVVSANNGSYYPGLVFGYGSGETISSQRGTNGSNRYGLDFYTSFNPRLSIASNGNIGINTTAPGGLLDINTGAGSIQFRNDSGFAPCLNLTGGSNPGVLRLRNALEIWPSDNGVLRAGYLDVRSTTGTATIQLNGANGEATVKVLTVTGGADIAEPFLIAGAEIPKGALVVIDEANPGRLKLSQEAYDTRVAGIVSGANGVKPGLSLHQEGTLDQGQQVALTGRAYALADASQGAIRPGDLLTTSGTPGYAMKVSDPARATGAVIGKAMTPLKEGKGMVLVLVNLQ